LFGAGEPPPYSSLPSTPQSPYGRLSRSTSAFPSTPSRRPSAGALTAQYTFGTGFSGHVTRTEWKEARKSKPITSSKSLGETVHEGPVLQREKKDVWKHRFARATQTRLLIFRDQFDEEPRFSIDLLYPSLKPSGEGPDRCIMIVHTDGNTVTIKAENAAETDVWLDCLVKINQALIMASAETEERKKKGDDEGISSMDQAIDLSSVLSRPENKCCCDCGKPGPQWALVNYGCFICLECAGIHRQLGVQISVVRSVTADTWTEDQVAKVSVTGNVVFNRVYEANLTPEEKSKILPSSPSMEERKQFITSKYVDKKWFSQKAYEREKAKRLEEPTPKTPIRSKSSKTAATSPTRGPTYPNQLKKSQKSSSSIALLGHQSGVRLRPSSDSDHTDLIRALDEDPQVQRLVANLLLNGSNQDLLKKVVLSACKTDPEFKSKLKVLLKGPSKDSQTPPPPQ